MHSDRLFVFVIAVAVLVIVSRDASDMHPSGGLIYQPLLPTRGGGESRVKVKLRSGE